MILAELRAQVCAGNQQLFEAGLVVWTGGNLSARDPETGLVAIKPSGMQYGQMRAEDMVVLDLDGNIVDGARGPSSDTASHLRIYRLRPELRGIVHTHSNYASAFAAAGMAIPCCLTAIADEFGGPVPCGDYAPIGGTAIGDEVVRQLGRSPAILMKQHGVFTVGATIEKAIKAAVMVEDVAKTVSIAMGIGRVESLPAEEIAANFERYQHRYGTGSASIGVRS